MSGGVGRGRGWLNLKTQNQSAPNTNTPGPDRNTTEENHSLSLNHIASEKEAFSDATDDFTDIINKIKQLNINDDGIKFNQKIRYIIEGWNEDCQNAVEVERSFNAIYSACLSDAELTTKLVLLIASRTFLSQEIHKQNIRYMFLRKLQNSFENCVHLFNSNPSGFRNSVQMMGEFFNKARLSHGQRFSFMAQPLISYFEMLLESTETADLKLFATQFYLTGPSLKQECPEQICDLQNKIRSLLSSDKKYSKECKLWLLLALEVAGNRFALLPAETYKYYQEQLGDQAMGYFQGLHGALSVQTVTKNATLDGYQSNVNVLQVSTPADLTASDSSQNLSDYNRSATNFTSGFHSDSNNQSDSSSIQSGKAGRPILGAGARLQKPRIQAETSSEWESDKSQESSFANAGNSNSIINRLKSKGHGDSGSENDGNWRDRENKKGNSQPMKKKDWDKKTPPKASSKGWQHDDRFDTDYS